MAEPGADKIKRFSFSTQLASAMDAVFDQFLEAEFSENGRKYFRAEQKKNPQTYTGCGKSGGDEETRTPDPLHAKQRQW
jgi:hypothetical protein